MSRRLRFIAFGLVGAALAAGAAQTPRLLRRLDTFRVRRVEVRGTRFMAPHAALAASGITRSSNLFDDPEAWRRRLLKNPLVRDARIQRRLPGTVILTVRETEPIALARGAVLQPVDARGRLLPIDPALMPVDLPVLDLGADSAANGELGSTGRTLLRALDRIRRLEPDLAQRVSEAGMTGDGSIQLRLRNPASALVLLPADPDPLRLRELMSTFSDLGRRQELDRLRRLDGRFREQIVVSLNPMAG